MDSIKNMQYTFYLRHLKQIFAHIMNLLDWNNLYGSLKKYAIFIEVWLNYSIKVILIWYNHCIKQTLIIDELLS